MKTIKYLFVVAAIACAAVYANAQNLVSVAKYGPYNNLSIQVSQIDSMTVDAEGNIVVALLDKSYTTIRDYQRLYIGEESAGGESMNIIRWMVNSDRDLGSNAFLNLYHYAVTEMPEADLTLFLPSDNAFKYTYDPISFSSRCARVMRILYNGKSNFPFVNGNTKTLNEDGITWYVLANYDVNTGLIGKNQTFFGVTQTDLINRMRSMLLNHCIFNTSGNSIESGSNEYFKTIGGAPVKVVRENGKIIKVLGGFQLENEREFQDAASVSQGVMGCNITEEHAMGNGHSYTLDSPIIPASRSVWSLLANVPRGFSGSQQSEAEGAAENNPYQKFYELCDHPGIDIDEVIRKSGLVDETQYDLSNASQIKKLNAAVARYSTFVEDNGVDYNLSFLKNGDFTLFVPSNEAMDAAYIDGLPTWEDIIEDFENCNKDDDGNLIGAQDSIRLQTKIMAIHTFIRSHFCFGTAFADQEWGGIEERCPIVFADGHKNIIRADCPGNGKMRVSENGNTANVIDEFNGRPVKNIFVSEYRCDTRVRKANSLNGITIDFQSYGTVHLIDGVLNRDYREIWQN